MAALVQFGPVFKQDLQNNREQTVSKTIRILSKQYHTWSTLSDTWKHGITLREHFQVCLASDPCPKLHLWIFKILLSHGDPTQICNSFSHSFTLLQKALRGRIFHQQLGPIIWALLCAVSSCTAALKRVFHVQLQQHSRDRRLRCTFLWMFRHRSACRWTTRPWVDCPVLEVHPCECCSSRKWKKKNTPNQNARWRMLAALNPRVVLSCRVGTGAWWQGQLWSWWWVQGNRRTRDNVMSDPPPQG